MTERPKRPTEEMKQRAAAKMAAELAKDGLIEPSQVDGSAADIAQHCRGYGDGYTLARDLEKYRYWECDLELAEALDAFYSLLREEVEAAEKKWFEQTSPQPQFANGISIKLRSGETGVIDGIYEYGVAKYLVKIDGDKEAKPPHNARRIVNFEDALAA